MMSVIRHAVLTYRGTPFASTIAVVTLAAAIAIVCAFISMWTDLNLKPPNGFDRGGRLVTIGQSGGLSAAGSSAPLTFNLVEEINAIVNAFEFAAGVTFIPQMLELNQRRVPVRAEAVTRHFSDLRPILRLGRLFHAQDHLALAEPVVILSYRLWQNEFDGRSEIIGQTIRISEIPTGVTTRSAASSAGTEIPALLGQEYRIIGVLSEHMVGTFNDTIDIWLPYEQVIPFLYGEDDADLDFELGQTSAIASIRGGTAVATRMRGLARLAPGATSETARNELNARLQIDGQAVLPGMNLRIEEVRFDVTEGAIRDIEIQREARQQVKLLLLAAVLLVIVSACNISMFFLWRASKREQEFRTRFAVGASMSRLARQTVGESGLFILLAMALGMLLSLWLSAALRALPFLEHADWLGVSPVEWRVLATLALLALSLVLIISIAPIIGLRQICSEPSRGKVTIWAGRGQSVAATTQIALTGAVSAAALAITGHFVYFANVDRGFDPERVLVVELDSETTTQPMTLAERRRQLDWINNLPSVEDASFASYAPGDIGTARYTIVQREAGNYVEFGQVFTDEHFIDVLGITLIDGTNLDSDDPGPFLGNESYAIGTFGRSEAAGEFTPTGLRVRGVVRDVAFGHPAEAIPQMGINAAPLPFYPLLLIKGNASPSDIRKALEDGIDAGALEIGIATVQRLTDVGNRVMVPDRARMMLMATSAILMMILSTLGFYGTMRYLVTVGQREYAIRAAVGGHPRSLLRLVLLRGLRLALPGLTVGGVSAIITVALLRSSLVTTMVSTTLVTLSVLLLMISLVVVASVGPAVQASRSAPATLLRES